MGSKEETLEEMFEKLEGIIEDLEDKDIEIEKAFAKYEEGMKLLSNCNDRIDTIEKKVMALSDSGELSEL